VTDDELLPIGRFARASGLTIGALRHYDEEGVLVPADVDPATGYRRYRADQLQMARAVAALRDLELSIPAIRALLDADDPATRATILQAERVRLEARTARLQRALHRLHMLSITAEQRAAAPPAPDADADDRAPAAPLSPSPTRHVDELSVPTPPPPPTLDPETHRALAAGLFNRSWDLLEIEDRTARQDAELIDTAHASAWHWRQVGNAANEARGHWMLARVYSVLGHGAEAVYHARRANEVLDVGGDGIEDWDRPAAAEAMARALVASGDLAAATEWKAKAETLLATVVDPDDRGVVEGDLAALPV
jgi:DNA-binding transcriptional MerR regulator